jgi:chemotaxis protein methyltransferase CheR
MTRALDPQLLSAVSQSVEAQLGLHFPPERWTDLERGLGGAAAELGFENVEKCARELVLAKLNHAQVDALAAHLTIGETYFFRDPATFEALASQVFPALAQEKQGLAKRLRIWSAGCCTGEEPYSIAIALRRALPDLDDWQITILATDINPQFLRRAAAGVYGQWSFRGVPEETRAAYFRRTPEGRFALLPSVRKMVTFACLNLVEDVYPSLANNTNAMDLIFCRNVLMYFSGEQIRKVVANLRRSLVDGGRLVVSATEASLEVFGEFVSAGIPGITLYRKETPAPPVAVVPPPSPPLPARLPEPVQLPAAKPRPAPVAPLDHAAEARRLANEGQLAEALAACDRALAEDKLVAPHHYLRGVILQEHNALDEAVAALKRALYLDPDFVIAHFALGHLHVRKGRSREAARCFANARSLLRTCAPDAVLPESDGITAGRLREILTSMEEALA